MKSNDAFPAGTLSPIVGVGASAGGLVALAQLHARWCRVRTMSYHTQENRIDGLVITFSDISASKKLEAELRATQARLQTLMESSRLLGVGNGLS